jgi:hypothetical protein
MARHLVTLAALFAQPHPQPPVLRVDVVDAHRERGADPRKRKHHQADQRPVAQAGRCADIDAVEQLPRLGRIEHRGCVCGSFSSGTVLIRLRRTAR